MWHNCFYFILVTCKWVVFQNCKEILSSSLFWKKSGYVFAPNTRTEIFLTLLCCWWCKKTLNLIVFLPPFLLFINKYCLPKHNNRWTGRESYWSNFYFDSQVVSLSVIHMICAILLGIGKYLNEYYFHFTQKQIYLPWST